MNQSQNSGITRCQKSFPVPLSSVTKHIAGELRYTYRRTKPEEQFVVPYNTQLLLLWKAHINVQYCTTSSVAKYVTKYVTKPEPKSIVNIRSVDHVAEHLRARRMSSMETMVLLLSYPIFQMSSGTIYLPTSSPQERSFAVKPAWILETEPDNIYFPDALQKYFARPQGSEFADLKYFDYFSKVFN